MSDTISRFESALIQHGESSKRIYVMEFPTQNINSFPQNLIRLAQKKRYTKIVCKTPLKYNSIFLANGFQVEAIIPGFYNEKEDAIFECFYLDKIREKETYKNKYEEIVTLSKNKMTIGHSFTLPPEYKVIECNKNMIPSLVNLYCTVFPSYPFPIQNPAYLYKTMQENVTYYGILLEGELIAASSLERSFLYNNCEMTDFATLPKHRNLGLGCFLLHHMETNLQKEGISVVYTIARSISFGMNITFAKNNYLFGGRLKNNTDIAGSIESMNVWYKKL